jgi:sugar lactone lactonase YvrE
MTERRGIVQAIGLAAVLALAAASARADILYVGSESVGRDVNKINSAGAVSVFANLPPGSFFPQGLAFDVSGNLFAADNNADKIFMITPTGTLSLFRSLPTGSFPLGLAYDGSGDLYVANNGAHQINKISPAGTLSLFATLPIGSDSEGLAFDSSGNLYTADGNTDQIRKITPSGTVSLFATLPAGSAPLGLAFDDIGNLYAANLATDSISKITPGGAVSLFATLPVNWQPIGLAFDTTGNLYAAGVGAKINKITPNGTVSYFASGTSTLTYIAVTDDTGHPLAVPPATLLGDYNRNGTVDAADYTLWRDGLGSVYNQFDYQIWKSHFGEMSGGSLARATGSVPEPAAIILLTFALPALARTGRRKVVANSRTKGDNVLTAPALGPLDGFCRRPGHCRQGPFGLWLVFCSVRVFWRTHLTWATAPSAPAIGC